MNRWCLRPVRRVTNAVPLSTPSFVAEVSIWSLLGGRWRRSLPISGSVTRRSIRGGNKNCSTPASSRASPRLRAPNSVRRNEGSPNRGGCGRRCGQRDRRCGSRRGPPPVSLSMLPGIESPASADPGGSGRRGVFEVTMSAIGGYESSPVLTTRPQEARSSGLLAFHKSEWVDLVLRRSSGRFLGRDCTR